MTSSQEIVADGWAKAYWCGDPACEAKIKDDTKATSRNIPLDQEDARARDLHCLRRAG